MFAKTQTRYVYEYISDKFYEKIIDLDDPVSKLTYYNFHLRSVSEAK